MQLFFKVIFENIKGMGVEADHDRCFLDHISFMHLFMVYLIGTDTLHIDTL